MIVGLEKLLGAEPGPGPELQRALESLFDGVGDIALIGLQPFKAGVHRLCLDVAGERQSVVIKRLDPDVAWRNQLVATRWLPSVGLDGLAPALLGVAPEGSGESVWHIYEDLGDLTLEGDAPDPSDIEHAVRAIADLHTRFAGEPRLAEYRLWGGDLGIAFVAASVRDASSAVGSLDPSAIDMDGGFSAVRDRLLGRLSGLLDELPRRAEEMASWGGPETLLHGDLWRPNIVPQGEAGLRRVCLLDWDHAGVGPIAYDLSTLLLRFTPDDRPWILDLYRESVAPAGWTLADPDALNAVFDTAERGRIANRVIWPAIAIIEGDRRWGPAALSEIDGWFEALAPVLPDGRAR